MFFQSPGWNISKKLNEIMNAKVLSQFFQFTTLWSVANNPDLKFAMPRPETAGGFDKHRNPFRADQATKKHENGHR